MRVSLIASVVLLSASVAAGQQFCKVHSSSQQGIPAGSLVAVSYPTVDADTSGYTGTQRPVEKFTVPAGLGGWYLIASEADVYVPAGGRVLMGYSISGPVTQSSLMATQTPTGPGWLHLSWSGLVYLAQGWVFQINVRQDIGAGVSLSTGDSVSLSMYRIP